MNNKVIYDIDKGNYGSTMTLLHELSEYAFEISDKNALKIRKAIKSVAENKTLSPEEKQNELEYLDNILYWPTIVAMNTGEENLGQVLKKYNKKYPDYKISLDYSGSHGYAIEVEQKYESLVNSSKERK